MLSKISIVINCRLAAIASAKLDDWATAEYFFLFAVQKSAKFSRLHNMVIGLMADTAFAQWKLKKYESNLNTFLSTLEQLEKIPDDFFEPIAGMCSNPDPNEEIKNHKIVDLSGTWVLLGLAEAAVGLKLGIQKKHLNSLPKVNYWLLQFMRRQCYMNLFLLKRNLLTLLINL